MHCSGSGGLAVASSDPQSVDEVSGNSGGRATAVADDVSSPSGAQAAAANGSGDGSGEYAHSLETLLVALQSDPTGMEFGSKARECAPKAWSVKRSHLFCCDGAWSACIDANIGHLLSEATFDGFERSPMTSM